MGNHEKEERLFMTYASIDFMDKPSIDIEERPPEGLFGGSCEKGIVWAMPITSDWVNSITNISAVAPNYTDLILFFKSKDYHKIDKLAWEMRVALGDESSSLDVFDYINDDLDDDNAEFIVPYEDVRNHMCDGLAPLSILKPNSLDYIRIFGSLTPFLKQHPGFVDDFYAGVDLVKQKMLECGYKFDSSSLYSIIDEEKKIAKVNREWVGAFVLCFNSIILPFFICTNSNIYCGGKNGFPNDWSQYCAKYVDSYLKSRNQLSKFFIDGCSGGVEEYDKLKAEMRDFFDISLVDVYSARMDGFNRNEKCPCGSGKKWKKCHGKYYG